jgi:curved DNA-binding protein CbpA
VLSLELHPDKNKSPHAAEEFQKVKHAFDVLMNPDTRHVYDRLGDAGVNVAARTVIDHKYIIIQMLVYYFSSVVFAFLMTFAEPSGDAMSAAFFGLTGTILRRFAHESHIYSYKCLTNLVIFILTYIFSLKLSDVADRVRADSGTVQNPRVASIT